MQLQKQKKKEKTKKGNEEKQLLRGFTPRYGSRIAAIQQRNDIHVRVPS